MPKGKLLSDLEKSEIDALHLQNKSFRAIGKSIGRSATLVTNYLKDREGYGTHRFHGGKEKLSLADKRRVIQEMKDDPSLSVPGLKRKLGWDISRQSIWRCLRKYGGEGGWEALMKEEGEEKVKANSSNNVPDTGYQDEDDSVGGSEPVSSPDGPEEEEEYSVPSPLLHVPTPTPVTTVSISKHSMSHHFLREVGALEQAILQTQLVFEEWFQSGGVDMQDNGLLDYLRSLIVKMVEVGSIIPEVKRRLDNNVKIKVEEEEPEEEYLLNEGVLIETECESEGDEIGYNNDGPLDRYFSAFDDDEQHGEECEANPTTTSLFATEDEEELLDNADQPSDPQSRDTKFYTGDDDQPNGNYDDDEDYDPSANDWDPGIRRKRLNFKRSTNTWYNCDLCQKRYRQNKPTCSCDQHKVRSRRAHGQLAKIDEKTASHPKQNLTLTY